MFASLSVTTWLVIILTSLILLFYRYATSTFHYFHDMAIPGPKPLPLVGNLWGAWRKNSLENDVNLMKQYGRIVGIYEGRKPNLLITDVNLISKILIKDFDKFTNRRGYNVRSKINRMYITVLRGQQWKKVRSSISPIFTTGKIKRMSVIIQQCTDSLIQTLQSPAQNAGKLDPKKPFGTFTMDVIAKCAFGINIEDMESGNDPFTLNARAVFTSSLIRSPLILIPYVFPWITKFGGEKAFMTKPMLFFQQVAMNMVAERQKNPQNKDDFITLALESIKELTEDGQPIWDDSEVEEIVIAQSTLFLLAGFGATSTALALACYCLAMNPHVQNRLYQEICHKIDQYESINYDMVNNIPYAEQFVNEVLRFYPPGLRLKRECLDDVQYGDVLIKKDCIVSIPVYALHHDERYYPDPERFDPERWTPENKAKRSPYCFLPFGGGPRNCIGMRFALEEMKLALCNVIHRFRFYRLPETPAKLEQEAGYMMIFQPKDFMIGIELRQ